MIKLIVVVLCMTCSEGDELEELFSQNFIMEQTIPPPTVSGVPQYYNSDSSNFTEVTISDFFVDKTLLIKELMDNQVSKFLEISAGPHFGKSTNMDMIKCFLEINVDEKSGRISRELTVNYKAFTKDNLEISKHKQVFDDHFGKYPVVTIDYKLLETVTNFEFLLRKCREILYQTFSHHIYLLEDEECLSNRNICRDDFDKYVNKSTNINLVQSEIEAGFIVLSELLYKYFHTPVVVLIDNYDMIVDAPVSENCRDSVYNFIIDMNNRIIESRFVSRVLLTGSLLRGGIPYSPRIKSALEKYPQFLKYYGLSKNELHLLLQRVLNNCTEIENAMDCIIKNYSGYVRAFEVYDEFKINPMNEVVCSVWSVIQYLTCVRKINIGVIGESYVDVPSITYLSVKDRARLLGSKNLF